MAKNNSFVKLDGTLDNLTFYRRNGESLVKTKSSISRARLMNDPKFKRSRENMREFGGAAIASKSFRTAFAGSAQKFGDTYMGSRMTGIMKRIVNSADGIRGERDILVSDFVDMLKGFEFNYSDTLNSRIFRFNELPIVSADRNSVAWELAPFSPDALVKAPEGATHFKIVFAAGYISNFEYNHTDQTYKPTAPGFDGMSASVYSAAFALSDPLTTAMNLNLALIDSAIIADDISVLVGAGIAFYQQVSGQLYELASGSAMKVVVTG